METVVSLPTAALKTASQTCQLRVGAGVGAGAGVGTIYPVPVVLPADLAEDDEGAT
jgi:hypothetical protein